MKKRNTKRRQWSRALVVKMPIGNNSSIICLYAYVYILLLLLLNYSFLPLCVLPRIRWWGFPGTNSKDFKRNFQSVYSFQPTNPLGNPCQEDVWKRVGKTKRRWNDFHVIIKISSRRGPNRVCGRQQPLLVYFSFFISP
jgi:hypothetical protein